MPRNGEEEDDQQEAVSDSISYLTRELSRLRSRVESAPSPAAAPASSSASHAWITTIICVLSVLATSFISVGRYQQVSETEQQRIAQVQADTKERFTEVWTTIHAVQLQNSEATQNLVELRSDMRYVKQWVDRQDRERKP